MTGTELYEMLKRAGLQDYPIKALDKYGFFHIITEEAVSFRENRILIVPAFSKKPKKENN